MTQREIAMKKVAIMGSMVLAGLAVPALAAPNDGAPPAAGQRVPPKQQLPDALVNFGLCSGPTNAAAFPSSPVPVVNGQCDWYQEFKSVSPDANYGGTCGGYTTAFGPQGDLKLNWKRSWLRARWVAEPLTSANCSAARIAAVAWGYRCNDTTCGSGQWEPLGVPTSRKGQWSATNKVCSIHVDFFAGEKIWQTLSIDAIATLTQDGKTVRRPVGATIQGTRPNAQCPEGTYTVPQGGPPVQAASQAHLNKKYP